MNAKLFLLPISVLTLLVSPVVSPVSATVITFDDLSETASGSFIANPYHGLAWNNFAALNAVLTPATFGVDGYYYGFVSASNVAFNALGGAAGINSVTNFNFLSAYLTGAWNSNLNIEVQGFNGTNLLYDTAVAAAATNATLFTFNYLDIDHLTFNSSGGQNAGFAGSGEQFVMDNFTFEFVPEPSSLLLASAAALLLCPLLKRRRV